MAKATAQFTIVDFNDVNISTTAPASPVVDQLWLDSSIVPNQLKRWTGSSWAIVNDVQVGGTNLVKNSSFELGSTGLQDWGNASSGLYYTGNNIASALYNRCYAYMQNLSTTEKFLYQLGIMLKASTTYTVSFYYHNDMTGNSSTGDFYVLGQKSATTGTAYDYVHSVTNLGVTSGNWVQKTLTFTTASDEVKCIIRLDNNGSTAGAIRFGMIQLEEGNKATAWKPCPEDIQSQLDTINNDLYTPTTGIKDKLTTTISDLSIAQSDITAKVGKTEIETYKNKNLKVRYIRDWLNGSTANSGNHWVELKVMSGKINRASGKTPTSNQTLSNGTRITDGITTSGGSDYASGTDSTNQYIQIDLGQVYEDLDYIQVWHYWSDGRTYNGTKTQVSEDGTNWVTLFDSAISGKYKETSSGFVIPINTGWALNTINSRIADAELKITDDAITASVRNHSSYQGDLNNLGGKNKWLVKKYPRTPVGTAPTFDLIANILATQTVEISDRTSIYPSSDATIFGSTSNDNYLGVATTYVYCTSAFALNTSVMHDNGGSIYLNNVKVYGGNVYISTPVAITLNFQKGWNRIDLLWEEATGGDGFSLGTTLSTNANISNMSCYYNIESVSESRVKIAEDQINLRVMKNNVVSEINQSSESIKIKANKIDINGAVTFSSFDSSMKQAIMSQGLLSTNPVFADWSSTFPAGFSTWGTGAITKETTLTRNGGYGARFNVTTLGQQVGMYMSSNAFVSNVSNSKYLFLEVDFMLVSGSLDGASVLVDWTGMATYRVQVNLDAETPSPTLNKWYTIRKVIQRPSDTVTGWTGMSGYVLANWSGSGDAVKDIIFDRVAIREATKQEIDLYNSKSGWDSTKSTVDSKATGWDSTKSTIDSNKSTWDRSSNINSDGTFNTSKLNGTIADSQIASATNWNGAKTLLDSWKSGTTLINGGMIATNTIFAQQIAIGDFTNLSQINEEKNPNGNTVITVNNLAYFKVGNGAYASLVMLDNTYVEFKVNDEYYIAWNGYRDSGVTSLTAILRYTYSDGTWNNAGSVTMYPTTSDTRISANLKVTTAPTSGKTVSHVRLFLEKDGTAGSGYYYVRDIEIRKRYTGELIVDGAITTNKIASRTITADRIQAGAITVNELASSVGSSLNISSNASITSKVNTADFGSLIEQNSTSVKFAFGKAPSTNLLHNGRGYLVHQIGGIMAYKVYGFQSVMLMLIIVVHFHKRMDLDYIKKLLVKVF